MCTAQEGMEMIGTPLSGLRGAVRALQNAESGESFNPAKQEARRKSSCRRRPNHRSPEVKKQDGSQVIMEIDRGSYSSLHTPCLRLHVEGLLPGLCTYRMHAIVRTTVKVLVPVC